MEITVEVFILQLSNLKYIFIDKRITYHIFCHDEIFNAIVDHYIQLRVIYLLKKRKLS